MSKLIDCFLYNNELELLKIRLRLLSGVVDRFAIAFSAETFTAKPKPRGFPWDDPDIRAFRDRIDLIAVEKLVGNSVWEKENYSRNLLARARAGTAGDDYLLISDVDEIPRPQVLSELRASRVEGPLVLGLDYFNFKFNYQLVHGTQAVWPGPILCGSRHLTTPQALRDGRWSKLEQADNCVIDAGWHFSFLTHGDDVREKLESYPHQEPEVQSRLDPISELIAKRQGFHDHQEPGSVWAIVDDTAYGCPQLTSLVRSFPTLLCGDPPDDASQVRRGVKLAMVRAKHAERAKMLAWFTIKQLQGEIWRRIRRRLLVEPANQ